MAKILLISDNEQNISQIQSILTKNAHELFIESEELAIFDDLEVAVPDILIIDAKIKNLDFKLLNKKINTIKDSIVVILLTENTDNINHELLKTANAFLQEPISKTLLLSTINANLRTKDSLDLLSTNNEALSKSLYQLDVLYNTSLQFAGTLEKDKLIDTMIENLDKALGFSLASTLNFRSKDEPVLIINSLYQIPDILLEALKLRAVLSYKSLFEKKEIPFDLNIENLKVEKHVKNELEEYNFSILSFDYMFAPLTLSENFFGLIEIYRETDFSSEDMQCFQTIAQQVSLPLKNASLYQEIIKTNKKLEKLEKLKSEFISIVSHELRTPLTSIKGAIDIIAMQTKKHNDEKIEKFINMGKDNVKRLSGIINDLLDLSKIEAGKMKFNFEITTMDTAFNYIKNTYTEIAKNKGLEFVFDLNDKNVKIYADLSRLEQVLNNLVSNAIKFTPKGGTIKIISKTVNAKDLVYEQCFEEDMKKLTGEYLMVTVQDEGVGIAKESLIHVFDQFSQIENSLSREAGGTGLGLPITKQMLNAHNGAIWCDSELKKGSSFNFVVPISSDKNNFWLTQKQLIQEAKTNNTTVATIAIKANEKTIENLEIDGIINKTYLNNSLKETLEGMTTLTLLIPDGDKFSAEFLKQKIDATICNDSTRYPKCDIMYSYSIYPQENN